MRYPVVAREHVRLRVVALLTGGKSHDADDGISKHVIEMIGDAEHFDDATSQVQHTGERVELELSLEHPIALVREIFVPAVSVG